MRKTLNELEPLSGKRVIVRCDFNVPLRDGVIGDDGRIIAALPTIRRLKEQGAKIILISHLGRPEGTVDERFSLAPVAHRLGELLNEEIVFVPETLGVEAASATAALQPSQILLLENLRFNPAETSKIDAERLEFAKELAAFADVFVSDGFGVVHRKQASVYELATLLPSAPGLLVQAELEVLNRITENPERPLTLVLGGSKVSDKLGVIDHLLPKVDNLLIGGGMVFTFLAALGHQVASSLLESEQIDQVKEYLSRAQTLGVNLVLPTDIVMAAKFAADAEHEILPIDALDTSPWGAAALGLDIGPESAQNFARIIGASKTVFWNGPMGVFEFASFAAGTQAVAQALASSDAFTVVGGGDSAAAVRQLGFEDSDFGHISTGGGASLEYLEGKKLPGLEVLGWQ
ncbi:MAG: phosphoglycerate kinase [Microbacteriaceae bacterium]